MEEYNIIHSSCSHCGKRKDQDKLIQAQHDPTTCICENCIIDYNKVLKEKEKKQDLEFLEVLSQFKDPERAIRLNRKLLKLEKLSPKLFGKICGYVDQIYSEVIENNSPEPPDIIA